MRGPGTDFGDQKGVWERMAQGGCVPWGLGVPLWHSPGSGEQPCSPFPLGEWEVGFVGSIPGSLELEKVGVGSVEATARLGMGSELCGIIPRALWSWERLDLGFVDSHSRAGNGLWDVWDNSLEPMELGEAEFRSLGS